MDTENKIYKRSRLMYIFEAAIEYFISILVSGSFLATLTKELGLSDSLTGVLSSVISLGCLFQLLSIFIRPKGIKKFVILMSVANQILFMILYIIPIFNIPSNLKSVFFVLLIFSAYFIYNIAHPKKINWLMSIVDDKKRGSFTANKEIVSLISGMVISFAMGALIDRFKEIGEMRAALILSALVLLILTVLHTLTMIFTVEKITETSDKSDFKNNLKEILKNKNILSVALVFVFYYIITYISTPFYGTYQINELGFSLKLATALTMTGSIVRIFVSRFWGRYADKKGFAPMIEKCFISMALAFLSVSFAVPSNGKIMFILYNIFHGIALGGINSALINLVFDYVSVEKRADSLAICQAISGAFGFVTTLCISPVITAFQKNGNVFLDFTLYGQQFVSIIAFIISVLAVVYIHKSFKEKNKA